MAFDVGNILVSVNMHQFEQKLVDNKLFDTIESAHFFAEEIQPRLDIGISDIRAELTKAGARGSVLDELIGSWMKIISPLHKHIDFIKKLPCNIALLSNTGTDHAEVLKTLDIPIYHFSCYIGARKPSYLFYSSFLNRYPLFFGSVFIDDRQINLDAAKEFFTPKHFAVDNYPTEQEAYLAFVKMLEPWLD